MSALAALREGAAALLAGRGEAELATIVRAARVELAGAAEAWSMGTREVQAHRVALGVPAEAFAALAGDAAKLDAVRAAFAHAMRSPDTELADLHVELLLPTLDRTWSQAYRDAPIRDVPAERPAPEAVLAGAAALLDEAGERRAAAMLARARLDAAAVPSASLPITRYVLQLATADRASTWQQPELEERLRRAIHDAASRAAEQVIVEVGVMPSG